MTVEILIVGDPDARSELADTVAEIGYRVSACPPRELNRRVRSSTPPTAILACMGDLDPDVLLAGLRRTRAGASIPVLLYGRLGGKLRDLADVLDIGADHFLEAPSDRGALSEALEQYAGAPTPRVSARADREPEGDSQASTRAFGAREVVERRGAARGSRKPSERGGLGKIHRTLDRLEARLRDRDGHESDHELAGLGLEDIPDVDPQDGSDVALVTDLGRHLEPSGEFDLGSGDSGIRTRDWARPQSEAPIRTGREREGRSAVLLGRRPGRVEQVERGDPNTRREPWPSGERRAEVARGGEARARSRSALGPARSSEPGEARDQARDQTRDRVQTRERGSAAPRSLHVDTHERASGRLGPDVEVPALLWQLHEQRFTGTLRLSRQRVEKQLWLSEGELVFARSTATRDRLVDGLLRRGVLTRPQYETARRLASKEPRRVGELLVDAGFLKPRELEVLLRDHLARVVDSTFDWREGSWVSEPGVRTDEPVLLDQGMPAVLLDGVRYRLDAGELEDRLTRRAGPGGIVPKLRLAPLPPKQGRLEVELHQARNERAAELGERFRLLPEEEAWLGRLDGRRGVLALVAEGADRQALLALLYVLELGGFVGLCDEPELEGERDPAGLDSERILERLRLAREADYFELLGVGRDASRGELRQAYIGLEATFAERALERDSRRRHARELRELRAALMEARDILVDEAMRSAYLAHLGDPSQ